MHASLHPNSSQAAAVPVRPSEGSLYLRVTHAREQLEPGGRPFSAPMRIVADPEPAGPAPEAPVMMDAAAYGRAVDAHSDTLYRYVVKHLRDQDEAKDIVQESYLRLWIRLDKVSVSGARSYLFTTANNLIVDRVRRKRHVDRLEPVHQSVVTAHQPKAGLGDALRAALSNLSPLQRTLVLMRDHEGHSYKAIAAKTGLDMTKVKVYLFRARRAMQAQLGGLDRWI